MSLNFRAAVTICSEFVGSGGLCDVLACPLPAQPCGQGSESELGALIFFLSFFTPTGGRSPRGTFGGRARDPTLALMDGSDVFP